MFVYYTLSKVRLIELDHHINVANKQMYPLNQSSPTYLTLRTGGVGVGNTSTHVVVLPHAEMEHTCMHSAATFAVRLLKAQGPVEGLQPVGNPALND